MMMTPRIVEILPRRMFMRARWMTL